MPRLRRKQALKLGLLLGVFDFLAFRRHIMNPPPNPLRKGGGFFTLFQSVNFGLLRRLQRLAMTGRGQSRLKKGSKAKSRPLKKRGKMAKPNGKKAKKSKVRFRYGLLRRLCRLAMTDKPALAKSRT